MKSLTDILFAYAGEYRIQAILHRFDPERWQIDRGIADSMDALEALGGEAKRLARRLKEQHNALSSLHEEAAFLAGLSIGLELGALGHGV